MADMAQPQAVYTANQPEEAAAESGMREGAPQEDAFLTVRYNKDELPLSREEAAVYAQKGLNYDKLSGRLEKTQELLAAYESTGEAVKEYAKRHGVSETEALADIGRKLGEERQKQETVNAQLDAFMQAHPDIDPRVLPASVLDAWKNGMPLIDAYARLNEQQRQKESVRQTNAQNAYASMGGAIGTGAAAPKPITEDSIRMMSPAELESNHSRIWAFLTGQKE